MARKCASTSSNNDVATSAAEAGGGAAAGVAVTMCHFCSRCRDTL